MDGSGFDEKRSTVLHYRIRAGTSEIARGSQPLLDLTQIYTDAMWSGTLDLTDAGASDLLPGYLVDVWFTGADAAGNPYDATNNSESNPYSTWSLIRTGPEIDLSMADITWSNPSPSGGQVVQLTVQGENMAAHSGEIEFVLIEEVAPGIWADVQGSTSKTTVESLSGYAIALELKTDEVDESTVRRFRLAARDGHIDIDVLTLEALSVQPYTARDGEALGAQIQESSLVFLLYLAALAFAAFGVAMLVMYRKVLNEDDTADPIEQTILVEDEMSEAKTSESPDITSRTAVGGKSRDAAPPLPPPGFDPNQRGPSPIPNSLAAPQALAAAPVIPAAVTVPAAPSAPAGLAQPAPLKWSDEQLMSKGWNETQIATWRAEQAQHAYNTGATAQQVVSGTDSAAHSDKVVEHVMKRHGLSDKAAFLAAAEFFDADGNRYLTVQELETAAASLAASGQL